MTTDTPAELPLDERTGLPQELQILLQTHPRTGWASARSPMADFWVQKHAHLLRQSAAIVGANDEYRKGNVTAAQFGSAVAPRLQGFLGELHGHHQIEDFHYFPAFRRSEPRLNRGFDMLGRDHELVHGGIMAIVEAVNDLITTIRDGSQDNTDAQKQAADRYMNAIELMHRRLERHLADEEDLIIPVMLKDGH